MPGGEKIDVCQPEHKGGDVNESYAHEVLQSGAGDDSLSNNDEKNKLAVRDLY